MRVCLFVCSLCIWTQYVPVQPKFPRILLSSRRRWRATFSENYKSFPPPCFSNQWNCCIPWYVGGQAIIGFRGEWVRIRMPFGWNPICWLRTHWNWFFEKFLNLDGMVAETVLEGFLEVARSNLMSIRLEILLVKLESISDKQFNLFRSAIRKIPYPPRENVAIWYCSAGKS